MALSADEETEIRGQMAHYPDREAVCIEAMKIVQRHRGYVSDEGLRDVADYVGMSVEALDAVATFYSLIYRKPVGRHVVMMCNSVSCWIMGSEKLAGALSTQLDVPMGGTTADGRFTLLPSVCLGACDHAPVLMVDDDLHSDVDPTAVAQLLSQYP